MDERTSPLLPVRTFFETQVQPIGITAHEGNSQGSAAMQLTTVVNGQRLPGSPLHATAPFEQYVSLPIGPYWHGFLAGGGRLLVAAAVVDLNNPPEPAHWEMPDPKEQSEDLLNDPTTGWGGPLPLGLTTGEANWTCSVTVQFDPETGTYSQVFSCVQQRGIGSSGQRPVRIPAEPPAQALREITISEEPESGYFETTVSTDNPRHESFEIRFRIWVKAHHLIAVPEMTQMIAL